jgi:hypothetical protein
MPSTINASNGASSGLISTGDASGVLALQTNNGTTALTLGTDQSATFASKVTITGTTSSLGLVLTNMAEVTTVSATAAVGTITYDVTTQSILYYTVNATANWTMNFRASSGTSLDSAMATGQAITVVFLATNGPTAYYNNAVQVDGSSVTPKYQGGTAWSSGNASSIDAYVYTIIKTGAATFTVLASQTRFA